ncbi:MAG: MurR/RpiR family transcriptional regulator [Psychrobium sp.]
MTQSSASNTILELIKIRLSDMRPSEKKVARVLISDYPVAGLESISQLSKRANVSGPTVIRFINSLDIESYPNFQRRLLDELQQKTQSPLTMYEETKISDESHDVLQESASIFVDNINSTFSQQLPSEFDDTLALLMNPKKRISCVGGRFSGFLSNYLALHLQQIRKDTVHLEQSVDAHAQYLLDAGKKDALLVFDFRRYEPQTITLANEAAKLGVEVILITDPYLSPIADIASVVLTTAIVAPSPFDSYVSATALVEAIVAGMIKNLDSQSKKRIAKLEEYRFAFSHLNNGNS